MFSPTYFVFFNNVNKNHQSDDGGYYDQIKIYATSYPKPKKDEQLPGTKIL